MIYMSRLGIWGEGTPFRTFEEFLHAIEKRCALHAHVMEVGLQRALLLICEGAPLPPTLLWQPGESWNENSVLFLPSTPVISGDGPSPAPSQGRPLSLSKAHPQGLCICSLPHTPHPVHLVLPHSPQ